MSRKFDRKLRIYCAVGSASATMLAAAAQSRGQVFQGYFAHDVGGNDPGSFDPTDAFGQSFLNTGDDTIDSTHTLGTDGATHSGAHLYLTNKFAGYKGNYLYTGNSSTGALANLPVGALIGPSNTPAGTAYENNLSGTDNDIAYTDAFGGSVYTPQVNSGSTPTQFAVATTGYYGFSIQPNGGSQTDYGYASITFDSDGNLYGNYAYNTTGGAIAVAAFPTSEWNAANSGDFTDASNWVTGVPGGVGFEANFGSFDEFMGGTQISVNIAAPTTLGTIFFNNKLGSYTLSGTGSLTMNASTGSAAIVDQMGTHTISVPVTFASSGILNASTGSSSIPSSLTLTQPVTFLNGGIINVGEYASLNITAPLTVAAGSLAVTDQAVFGATTGTINLAAVNVSSGANISFAYSYNGGTGVFALSSLTLGASATAQLEAPNSSTNGKALLQVGGLSLAPTSLLDLQINDLIVQGNTPLKTITSAIASGYNNGQWNGSGGITSSKAAADPNHLTALGVIENTADGTNPIYGGGGQGTFANFDGVQPNATDILVRYTYYGDANLDGQVDGSDYSLIDNGFLSNLSGWYNGDFNYDGVVNGSDYTLIDNAFNSQGGNLLDDPAGPSAQVTAEIAGTTSAVPEPASLSLLAMGAVGLLRRKR